MGLLNLTLKVKDSSEQWITVTCPVCSCSTEVESASGGLHAPTFRCTCGTVINNELGFFTPPI